jgi:hypothetical protein
MMMNKSVLLFGLCLTLVLLSGCSSDELYLFGNSSTVGGSSIYVLNVSNNPYSDWWIAFPDFTLKINESRTEGLKINYSDVLNVPASYNYSSNLALKLNTTDQRYNETSLITPKLDATDQRYNETSLITPKLDATDQRYNETSFITSNYLNSTTDLAQDLSSNFNMWGCYRNNTYCDGNTGNSARTTATAFSVNVLRCFPYIVGKGYKVDQLGFIVATANNTKLVKVALYSDNGFGYPNALLINTSSLNKSTTGWLSQDISAYQLTNNTLYWLCSATNNNGTTMRVNVEPLSDYPNILGLTSGTAGNIGYTVAYDFTNTLPNPYTAGATYLTAIYPSAYMRVRTDI